MVGRTPCAPVCVPVLLCKSSNLWNFTEKHKEETVVAHVQCFCVVNVLQLFSGYCMHSNITRLYQRIFVNLILFVGYVYCLAPKL